MDALYVIECRKPDGSLDFSGRQPERFFGNAAITGISENAMAKAVFRFKPDATMDGRHIARWPSIIDPRFIARQKTW